MKQFDTINVIPFIDIMLVLLCIVLTSASFIASGKLDISVPSAETAEALPPHPPSEVAIDKEFNIYFNEKIITLAELDLKLTALDVKEAVIFKIDETVPFKNFTHVLELLKKHHIEKLSIVTRPRGSH